jgi:hypothetical protein
VPACLWLQIIIGGRHTVGWRDPLGSLHLPQIYSGLLHIMSWPWYFPANIRLLSLTFTKSTCPDPTTRSEAADRQFLRHHRSQGYTRAKRSPLLISGKNYKTYLRKHRTLNAKMKWVDIGARRGGRIRDLFALLHLLPCCLYCIILAQKQKKNFSSFLTFSTYRPVGIGVRTFLLGGGGGGGGGGRRECLWRNSGIGGGNCLHWPLLQHRRKKDGSLVSAVFPLTLLRLWRHNLYALRAMRGSSATDWAERRRKQQTTANAS